MVRYWACMGVHLVLNMCIISACWPSSRDYGNIPTSSWNRSFSTCYIKYYLHIPWLKNLLYKQNNCLYKGCSSPFRKLFRTDFNNLSKSVFTSHTVRFFKYRLLWESVCKNYKHSSYFTDWIGPNLILLSYPFLRLTKRNVNVFITFKECSLYSFLLL